jgi:hypothetical protein
MPVRHALSQALRSPDAAGLWRLRAELLQAGLPRDAAVWSLLDRFQNYLRRLETGSSSRDYSHLASKLDIGALSGVVLENLLETDQAQDLALRIFTGLVSEGLMVLATRQHVKAWEGELSAVHLEAAWYLYGEMWRWAERRKPELPAAERRALLDQLFAPIRSDEAGGFARALLACALFQLLLLSHLEDALPRDPARENPREGSD